MLKAHLILQLSLAVMLPQEGKYSSKLWLRQDIFGIIGLLLGIHHFQTFALKIPSKVSWGDAGVEVLGCFHLLGSSGSAFCWKSGPHGEPREPLMVNAGELWRWQELSDNRALTILWSQKLEGRHSKTWKYTR